MRGGSNQVPAFEVAETGVRVNVVHPANYGYGYATRSPVQMKIMRTCLDRSGQTSRSRSDVSLRDRPLSPPQRLVI